MKNDLSHLSESELKALKERYYGPGTVKQLVEEYDLNIRPGDLYKHFPETETDKSCPHCGGVIMQRPISKSEASYRYGENRGMHCSICEHILNRNCRCSGCLNAAQKKRDDERKKRIEVLTKFVDKRAPEKVEIETASTIDRIYLGALLRSLLDENLETIYSLNELYSDFAPYYKFEHQILKDLEEKRFIKIDLDNCSSEFQVDIISEDRAELIYDYRRLVYKVNFYSKNLSQEEVIDSLINPESQIPQGDLLEIWKLISLNECYEYLNYTVGALFNIGHECGPKAELIFSDLLGKYSTAQIFNIIYSRGNYALRFKTEKRVNSMHAANSILTMIVNYSERVAVEKWELKNYSRPSDHQETILSKFFFGRILKIGDKSFLTPPSIETVMSV